MVNSKDLFHNSSAAKKLIRAIIAIKKIICQMAYKFVKK